MDKDNNRAKKWLKEEATSSEYNSIKEEAKLTPLQENIIDLIVLKDLSVVAISLALHMSDTTVKRKTKQILDKISRILSRHF